MALSASHDLVIPKEGVESKAFSDSTHEQEKVTVIPKEGVESFFLYAFSPNATVKLVIPKEGVESYFVDDYRLTDYV